MTFITQSNPQWCSFETTMYMSTSTKQRLNVIPQRGSILNPLMTPWPILPYWAPPIHYYLISAFTFHYFPFNVRDKYLFSDQHPLGLCYPNQNGKTLPVRTTTKRGASWQKHINGAQDDHSQSRGVKYEIHVLNEMHILIRCKSFTNWVLKSFSKASLARLGSVHEWFVSGHLRLNCVHISAHSHVKRFYLKC